MLLEHQREGAVYQRLVRLVVLEAVLDPARAREQVLVFVASEVTELQIMAKFHSEMEFGHRSRGLQCRLAGARSREEIGNQRDEHRDELFGLVAFDRKRRQQ